MSAYQVDGVSKVGIRIRDDSQDKISQEETGLQLQTHEAAPEVVPLADPTLAQDPDHRSRNKHYKTKYANFGQISPVVSLPAHLWERAFSS